MFVVVFSTVVISGTFGIVLPDFVLVRIVFAFTCALFTVLVCFMFFFGAVFMGSRIDSMVVGGLGAGDDTGFFQHDNGQGGGNDRQQNGDDDGKGGIFTHFMTPNFFDVTNHTV